MNRNEKSKSGKGKGLSLTAKRTRKILRDNIQGLSKPALRRLAYIAGIRRLQVETYDLVRTKSKKFLESILKDAIIVLKHDGRNTLQSKDVLYSLDRHDIKFYGENK